MFPLAHALALAPHPPPPPRWVRPGDVELSMPDADRVLLTFYIAPGEALAVPDHAAPARTDGLWQRTCCEMFLKPGGGDGCRDEKRAHGGISFLFLPIWQGG